MKRIGGLWDSFVSWDNFVLAYKNSIKGKASQRQVRKFKKNWEQNLQRVRALVLSGKFKTSKYREMIIHEPKERIIYKLPFSPDRIVQHAIMNILKPIMVNRFIPETYACIEGRGQHKASLKCSEYVRRNQWALKCDIRKFYPSIDQNILSEKLHRIIKDKRFMEIVDGVIFSFPGGKNCPIGNYCSQWFGNFYLSYLDSYVKRVLKCKDYERFCDDFILFSNDKRYLSECREKIKEFVQKELLLEFSKCDLFKTKQGVDFCGYRHFGKYVLLRKSTAKRMKRRLRRIFANKDKYSEDYIKSSIASTKGWLKHCCSKHFERSLFAASYAVSSRKSQSK